MANAATFIEEKAERIAQEYGAKDEPLGAYSGLLALYGIVFGGFVYACSRGKLNPHGIGLADILLAGIATHKLTRIIALDEVTSPVRAPFVHLEGEGDAPSELKEHPRGKGAQQALGTLISCPFCLAPWVGAAAVVGMVFAPKPTRFIASIFAVAAVSDVLNTAYDRAWKSE